jgi:hypothetical protein
MRGYAEQAWKERFGSKPSWVKKDFVQLARLIRRRGDLTLDEFVARWDRYLDDGDSFTARQGYSLAFFCSRFDSYIKRSTLDVPEIDIEAEHAREEEYCREQRRLARLREADGGGEGG